MGALRIGIVGGGIGGLTAAIALGRTHQVTLYERSDRFDSVGAGLVLAPNAVRSLSTIGVDLTPIGEPLTIMDIRRADDRLLQRLHVDRHADTLGPTLGVTRPDLHRLLVDRLPAPVEIRLGSPIVSLDLGGPLPAVLVGSDRYEHDLVIGADGIGSAVRRTVSPGTRIRYSGATCWRGFAPDPGIEGALESWGVGTRIGIVPVPGGRVYLFLVATAPERDPGPADLRAFRELFGGYAGAAGRLIDELDAIPGAHHDLSELDRPAWGAGRVLLLGDAAHAMTPNLGQGAAMAIEDAVVLARQVANGADGLVERYRRERHRRVRRIQLTARRLGRISHLEASVPRQLRDLAVRLTPDRFGDARFEAIAAGP